MLSISLSIPCESNNPFCNILNIFSSELQEAKLSDLFTPLYIGRSKHLKTRLTEHYVKPQRSIKDVYKITTSLEVLYTTCIEKNLAEVENRLIRAFGPITNAINAKVEVTELEPIKASLGKLEKH